MVNSAASSQNVEDSSALDVDGYIMVTKKAGNNGKFVSNGSGIVGKHPNASRNQRVNGNGGINKRGNCNSRNNGKKGENGIGQGGNLNRGSVSHWNYSTKQEFTITNNRANNLDKQWQNGNVSGEAIKQGKSEVKGMGMKETLKDDTIGSSKNCFDVLKDITSEFVDCMEENIRCQ
ncbi:unnamed protein product [Lactuca virosa]|uniref:BURP domain-containing protein n=1 Tax=Lactuca virosa TaxID=75947 RepID=A0AAU9LNW5_9ASTR|nr:unnamed protein product [Lactuca virosa]